MKQHSKKEFLVLLHLLQRKDGHAAPPNSITLGKERREKQHNPKEEEQGSTTHQGRREKTTPPHGERRGSTLPPRTREKSRATH